MRGSLVERLAGRTAILAAGDFPRKGGVARRILESARRIVCCDGAADSCRRILDREPDAVVGDCDSVRGCFANVRRIADQETNDLEKAAAFCKSAGWRDPVVLGATGRRDDHSIGNVFRAMDLGLEVVTDYGRFVPVDGRATFRLPVGSPISIFATDRDTRMSSSGLEWPLDGVRFDTLYRATLNRTAAGTVTLRSDRRVYAYIPFKP